MQCKNCNGLGHIKESCKEPLNIATVKCLLCTDIGYFKRDCLFKEGMTSAKFAEIKIRQHEAINTACAMENPNGELNF